MSYTFNKIETKWQKYWAENQTFKASNNSDKEKYYVLDMFPYPSGAGLHVGHPLGYIASDIYARYKRHQGFNVLHPQGYDSFGLPAEQYAIQTGQHPAITTKTNIARYREQLDKIGFSFDWSREVRTSNPGYYRWTQWIFIQLFESYYCKDTQQARPITELEEVFTSEGNKRINAACDDDVPSFSGDDWKNFSAKEQQEILLKYRLTYLAETEVNWCPALGTVLANDEIVNGVSERGGHPVVRKKMKQWSMRISAYAERLLQGLETLDWTDSLKESQRNWIGKSVGAQVSFKVFPSGKDLGGDEFKSSKNNNSSHPQPFPKGRESVGDSKNYPRLTGNPKISGELLNRAKEMRKNLTKAEALLWDKLKGKKIGFKFRRQHPIDNFIVDFVCLSRKLILEVDGEIHNYQQEKDEQRDLVLEEKLGYKVLHYTNDQVINDIDSVLEGIKNELENQPLFSKERKKVLPSGEDLGGDDSESHPRISVFTTRPDTIFGVTFMTLAPEHELVSKITTPEQKEAVEAYVEATAKRSERERMADVKSITGVFTGAYAEHPFTKEPIPIWIGDYVLASYGTGAVMAVPCGDQRDYDFAKHFDIPIKNIFKDIDISEAAHTDKDGTVLTNSDFLNDLPYKKAMKRAIFELEEIGQGEGKTNYRLRDAVFSRQRYWGEPFPVYYKNGMPQMIAEKHLPLRLPEVEKYLPTEEGEPPLGRADVWAWDTKNHKVVSNKMLKQVQHDKSECHSELDSESHDEVYPLELNTMPGWAGSSWYFFRYMESEKRDEVFASQEALDYWKNVDLYIGGSEHATGHLLYARFWTKFLKDRGFAPVEEPFKKLINQGMILGESAFVYRIDYNVSFAGFVNSDHPISLKEIKTPSSFISKKYFDEFSKIKSLQEFIKDDISVESYIFNLFENSEDEYSLKERLDDKVLFEIYSFLKVILKDIKAKNSKISDGIGYSKFNPYTLEINIIPIHADVSLVNTSNELDIEGFKNWRPEFKDAEFITEEDGTFVVSREVEKMSKSKYNVVNPDDICEEYGADTLRMYEMFLGPIDQAKPWNTAGITGVHNFLKKLWKLYHNGEEFAVTDTEPSKESLKTLHKTIKKVTEDIEAFSFNTSVSTFMICVNELTSQKCTSKEVLEPLAVLISPYAPHIAEELWSKLGNHESISTASYPKFEEKHLKESSKTYPISFNGKMRFTMDLSLDLSKEEIEKTVMNDERTQKQLNGHEPKKIIIVPGKIVNIVG